MDSCRLLVIYNDKDVYLYSSAKYDRPRLFYTPNYYYLPKWADAEKLTLLQAVKIINYRMKNNDSDNLKPEDILALEGSPARKERWSVPQDKPRENTRMPELKIDKLVDDVKNKK